MYRRHAAVSLFFRPPGSDIGSSNGVDHGISGWASLLAVSRFCILPESSWRRGEAVRTYPAFFDRVAARNRLLARFGACTLASSFGGRLPLIGSSISR